MAQQTETPEQRDGMRDLIHAMWSGVAPQWAEYADWADQRGAEVTELLLTRAGVTAGDAVLELACGPGGAGLAAAERVGSTGEVLLTDVSSEMAAAAGARAAARGLTNVRTATIDIEEIDLPDASFDVALCREGLMFAVDPARALREIHRVVRPDGRVALAVWGPKADNPWLGVVLDTVGEHLGHPVPPPGVPGPFSLDDATRLRELCEATFADVTVETASVPSPARSFEEWWTRTCALAGPLASIIPSLPEDSRDALEAKLRTAIEPYATGDGFRLAGLALVASGRRT